MNVIDVEKRDTVVLEVIIESIGQASVLTRGYGDEDWEKSTQNGYSRH